MVRFAQWLNAEITLVQQDIAIENELKQAGKKKQEEAKILTKLERKAAEHFNQFFTIYSSFIKQNFNTHIYKLQCLL